ncbi:PIN domain-containing protein [Streptomyces parvulus]|uniref:PIN domain-containing protein n=1 Tax=Streptomyces parvulus TaxID=146923 RepID=UPI00210BBDB0|nr:PIN domain-containing protein [Streptomyces parvulus]MCQ4194435.1 PIN domain-containing protein [Streptomyces parvulus]
MIVVLDTTVFSSDFTCSGTAWRVLAHASKAWGLQIRVPEVVVAEAVGGYEREIGHASLALEKVVTKYSGRLGLGQPFADLLGSLQERRRGYQERLTRLIEDLGGTVLPPPDVPHMELARRAASRRKPCDQKGDGYRDTLNWLLILEIAESSPEETIFWVTDNSTDFANEEKDNLHEDLLEDLEGVGATSRVRWFSDLSSLLLSLAASHYDESSDDLRNVRDNLQRGAIAEFINASVLPSAVKKLVSPRRCALPLDALKPEVLAVQGVQGLELEVKGVAEQGGAFAEFSFTAEALIGLDLADTATELPEGFERGDGIDRSATVLKELGFQGLIELDSYGRPVSGEVSNIDALIDDPGLEPWKSKGSGLASLQAALSGLQHHNLVDPVLFESLRPKIDPGFLDAMRPKIDSGFLDAMRPKIDSGFLDAMRPKIDSGFLDAMRPKIDPGFLDAMRPKIDPGLLDAMRPKIDPKVFEGMFPTVNAFKRIADSSAFASAFRLSAAQADLDDDGGGVEEISEEEGDGDASDV